MRRSVNDSPQIIAPLRINLIIKHVRQRRAEHLAPDAVTLSDSVPFHWLLPVGLACAAARMVTPLDQAAAFRPGFRVAIVAGWRDFGAAGPRIERVIRPFYLAVLSHPSRPPISLKTF